MKNKKWVLAAAGTVCAVLVMIFMGTGGTHSFFSATDKVSNRLGISDLSFEIEEPGWEEPATPVQPGDVLPKDPRILNNGTMNIVVRVKLQEVWSPKTDSGADPLYNPDYIRYFAASLKTEDGQTQDFPAEKLMELLKEDQGMEENWKRFALRGALCPNQSGPGYWNSSDGWYRGAGDNSEWLYYNRILKPEESTEPVFRAVTLRTAGDVGGSADNGAAETFNAVLSKYNLDIYVYAEVLQAESFAWDADWGVDIPENVKSSWGGEPE